MASTLAGETPEAKRTAINSAYDTTTVLGKVCRIREDPTQQAVLQLLLAEGGNPNVPERYPPAVGVITSNHAVGTLRALVEHGARMDIPAVELYLRMGHPTADHGGRDLRRYLRDELGLQIGEEMSEH